MLRRISTGRLLVLCAIVVTIVAAGGALAAGAFGGSGRTPQRKSLAAAVHDALNGPTVEGVTARIQFTDKLIDTSGVRGANPLLTGASGRLWATQDRLRLELQAPAGSEGAGDVQVVVDQGSFSVLDVGSNTLYRGVLPAHHEKAAAHKQHSIPSVATIQQDIKRVAQHLTLAGPAPGNIAGQPAYSLTLSPKQAGGLIGRVAVSWDATNAVPLRASVYAQGASTPTLELAASRISFGPVRASALSIKPPSNVKVVNLSTPTKSAGTSTRKGAVTGLAAVQAKLPFRLASPDSLAGKTRSDVSLLGADGALLSYGQGPGGVYVVEQHHTGASALALPHATSSRHSDLQLPTFQVGAVKGTEIATPLGTLIRFERGGVEYTVVGSVTKATAEAAARAL